MFDGLMRTMHADVVRDNAHASSPATEEGWFGFVCKECGAPLAVHRSTTASKTPARSIRGWRVACTGCGVTEYYEIGPPMVQITTT